MKTKDNFQTYPRPSKSSVSPYANGAFPIIEWDEPDEEGPFRDLNKTVMRNKMPHHPFTKRQVPYMQSYTTAVLEK